MFIRGESSVKEFMQFYPVVSVLIIINILVFLLYTLHLPIGYDIYNWGIGHNLAISYGEYWRLVTPIFLHGGFGHIVFNSFSLVLFGPALEQMLGKVKFIAAYFITGIFANVMTFIIDTHSTVPHLGASGAIYGLLGMYIFMVFFRKHLIDPGNAQIVVIIFVIGVAMSFLRPNINIAAHLFGAFGGFAIAPIALINAEPFSMIKNYMKVQSKASRNNDDIQFNPNRWNKKRTFNKKRLGTILWIVLLILFIFGIWSRFFSF